MFDKYNGFRRFTANSYQPTHKYEYTLDLILTRSTDHLWLITSKPKSCLQKHKWSFKNVLKVHLLSFKMTPLFLKIEQQI